MGDKSIVQL